MIGLVLALAGTAEAAPEVSAPRTGAPTEVVPGAPAPPAAGATDAPANAAQGGETPEITSTAEKEVGGLPAAGPVAPPSAEPPAETAPTVDQVRGSVVTLLSEDLLGRPIGNGTGFFVSADGIVATNEHVASAGPTVAVLADGKRVPVLGILASDEDTDLALLRVDGEGYAALPLADPARVAVEDPVFVIGSPSGFEQTLTRGVITALRPDGVPEELSEGVIAKGPVIQIDAQISPGSSGSPVLTQDGHVAGIAQSVNMLTDSYFAVDARSLRTLLDAHPADGALEPVSSSGRNLLMTLVFVGAVLGGLAAPSAWAAVRGGKPRGR